MAHCTPEELRERFEAEGYPEVARELIAGSRPAIAINREPVNDDDIPLGVSKLGGMPDLPQGTSWPRRDGRPLAFLGQFALADVPRLEGQAEELPTGGLLSVFYDAVEQPWGFDPKDKGGAVMLYWESPRDLARTSPPEGAYGEDEEYDSPFTACRVQYEVITTYPEIGLGAIRSDDGEAILGLYSEVVHAGQGDEDSPRHQFLGLPLAIQSAEMGEECQMASNGIYLGDGDIAKKDRARAKELKAGAKDWMLLLQIDSDDAAGWMWGDVGIIYFWIRRQDLASRDFSKAWCVLQCT